MRPCGLSPLPELRIVGFSVFSSFYLLGRSDKFQAPPVLEETENSRGRAFDFPLPVLSATAGTGTKAPCSWWSLLSHMALLKAGKQEN